MNENVDFKTLFSEPRQARILDGAQALFLRLGYTHTSTSAIAARTGVSKATLYTYWASKEQLFQALIVRESLRVFEAWEASILADPEGGTIGALCAYGFQALASNPLLQSLYGRDFASLGEVFRQRGTDVYTPRYLANLAFVRDLQAARIIRDDLPSETVNHLMQSLSLGLVTVGEMVDPTIFPSLEAIGAMVASTMQAALAPSSPASSEQGKQIILAYFTRLRTLMVANLATQAHSQKEQKGGDSNVH